MKINILYPFIDGPWGGANQFLAALRHQLAKRNILVSPEDADVILLNSHNSHLKCLLLKLRHRDKIIVHRIDGPMKLIRGGNCEVDKTVYLASRVLADGIIFQSQWSMEKNYELGLAAAPFSTVIHNAPNPDIFFPAPAHNLPETGKIRLVASSWSGNMRKGFDVFQWLDENLNFSRYEMTFIGNSPIKFKNIQHVPPLASRQLGQELRKHHIYIFASKAEGCSNALLEGLHCGLPAIVRRASCNPEIVLDGGAFFDNPDEIPALLEKIISNYDTFRINIANPSLEDVGFSYFNFMEKIYFETKNNTYTPKKPCATDVIKLFARLLIDNLRSFFASNLSRLKKLHKIIFRK